MVRTTTTVNHGITPIQSTDGQFLGHAFITPSIDGEMVFTNPGDASVTVTWRGGGISVAPQQIITFDWPPAGSSGAPIVDAEGDVFLTWRAAASGEGSNTSGVYVLAVDDTGARTGQHHTFHVDASTQTQAAQLMRA